MTQNSSPIQSGLKRFARASGRYLLKSIRWLINHMPYWMYRSVSWLFFCLGSLIMVKKKKIAQKNLNLALGKEKSQEEIKDIARKCFQNFGWGMIELTYCLDRPELVKERVKISGQEHLDMALKEGKGAILVGAHFGNFLMMYMRVVLAGYKTNVIMKKVRDEEFEKYVTGIRDGIGVQTIFDLPAKECVVQTLKALRRNEVLFILLDQNYGSSGRVFVDFFGEKAGTATGPAVFANRVGSPVLPIFMHKTGKNSHELIIDSPLEMVKDENEQQEIYENICRMTQCIESQIRKYPHEWGGWMHNRWKSKPFQVQRIVDRINEEKQRNKPKWKKALNQAEK